MFWFNKEHPDVLYVDKRRMEPEVVGTGVNARTRKCLPDQIVDFREMPFPDNSFSLVVFDPPHLKSLGEGSYTEKVYGKLNRDTWREDLTKGFVECFRVLKPDGVLIFKWNEYDIKVKEILALTPHQPLFGHPSGKLQKTHWITFMKSTLQSKTLEDNN